MSGAYAAKYHPERSRLGVAEVPEAADCRGTTPKSRAHAPGVHLTAVVLAVPGDSCKLLMPLTLNP